MHECKCSKIMIIFIRNTKSTQCWQQTTEENHIVSKNHCIKKLMWKKHSQAHQWGFCSSSFSFVINRAKCWLEPPLLFSLSTPPAPPPPKCQRITAPSHLTELPVTGEMDATLGRTLKPRYRLVLLIQQPVILHLRWKVDLHVCFLHAVGDTRPWAGGNAVRACSYTVGWAEFCSRGGGRELCEGSVLFKWREKVVAVMPRKGFIYWKSLAAQQ